jgi:competence ComEA-like helix-hairpin-helix protein
MKKFLTEYFYYTRTERNGALALGLLCIALFVAPQFFPLLHDESEAPDFEVVFASEADRASMPKARQVAAQLFPFDPNTASKADFIELGLSPRLAQTILNYRSKGGTFYKKEDLQKIYTLKNEDYERLAPYIRIGNKQPAFQNKQYYTTSTVRAEKVAEPFSFDPNTASREELMKLGLPRWISDNVVKYRASGGKFRKKADFRRIYGLSDADYERLEPYITLPEQAEKEEQIAVVAMSIEESPDFEKSVEKAPVVIDINRAGAADWQQLRGIGPAYAKRITKFRDKLGGFSSVQQIAETYGLPDSTFQNIKPQLQWSPVLRKIDINTATIESLRSHPYLDARQAAAMVSYREHHGAYQSIADLQKVKALPRQVLKKIEPYLKF